MTKKRQVIILKASKLNMDIQYIKKCNKKIKSVPLKYGKPIFGSIK